MQDASCADRHATKYKCSLNLRQKCRRGRVCVLSVSSRQTSFRVPTPRVPSSSATPLGRFVSNRATPADSYSARAICHQRAVRRKFITASITHQDTNLPSDDHDHANARRSRCFGLGRSPGAKTRTLVPTTLLSTTQTKSTTQHEQHDRVTEHRKWHAVTKSAKWLALFSGQTPVCTLRDGACKHVALARQLRHGRGRPKKRGGTRRASGRNNTYLRGSGG